MDKSYYQDELRFLREVGPDFAKTHPEIARYLGDPGADPDVERLLEGVAFLCGRIRQKLDDELPELTANMMSLLWPHYLRPIPSISILELFPEIEGMQGPLTVEAGSEFASIPIDGTRCRYRSCWPTILRPWNVTDVRLDTAAAQPVRLIIDLQSSPKAPLEKIDLGKVQFHLAGDVRVAFVLYLLLSGHLEHLTVNDGSGGRGGPEEVLPAEQVVPAGLDRSEAVLPYPPISSPGYRLLQEYFAHKEKYLFINVLGLDRVVRKLGLSERLQLTFVFNRRLDSLPHVSRDNVRLHCCPIINLFSHSAEPIRVRHDRVSHLIQPDSSGLGDRRHAEVYSTDSVFGLTRSTGFESQEYLPFYSFAHMTTSDPRDARYYQTHLQSNVLGGDPRLGTDTYISFVRGGKPQDLPDEETISIDLTCTNRHLPGELRAGDITEPTDNSPPGMRFRNILKPTPTIFPPLGKQLHWRLISHMSLNYVSLANATHFRELLRVYDFQAGQDARKTAAHKRMLDGILSVRTSFAERLVRGAPLRGTRVDIELDEDHFAGEGDAYLFATILDRFFAVYVTLNAYSQLTVRFARTGQVYTFPPRWGEQMTPAESRPA